MSVYRTLDLELNIEGTKVDLLANGDLKVSHSFMGLDKTKSLGIGALIPRATNFSNVGISEYFPMTQTTADSARTTQGMTEVIDVLANDQIAYDVDATLALPEIELALGSASVVNNQLQFRALDDLSLIHI